MLIGVAGVGGPPWVGQMGYFDTYNGFVVVGGISLMVYCFVAVVMLQCDKDSRSKSTPLLT